MSEWTFMEFLTSSGRGVITEWYADDLTLEAQQEFDTILRFLAVTPRVLWTRPQYSPLTPEISEIRFRANNLQHRPLGFFRSEAKQYIMVVGATKKGRLYTPREALSTAIDRKNRILTRRSLIRTYDY